MLLGAGELGKEVIIALQRLGVEVIAVDRYATRPASGRASRPRHRYDRRRRLRAWSSRKSRT
jgi:formate-dependent phosphoribosylglycinamide formyltransferase (GAR transformylase)